MNQWHEHGLSDERRQTVALESIARSIRILLDERIRDMTSRLKRSSKALERVIKATTPKS